MKHKHYDLILAWANGEKIQTLVPRTHEDSMRGIKNMWMDIAVPSWHDNQAYRIKPVDPVFVIQNLQVQTIGCNYYEIQMSFHADQNSASEFINGIRLRMINQE